MADPRGAHGAHAADEREGCTIPGEHRYIAQDKVILGRLAATAAGGQAQLRGAGRVFVIWSKALSRKTDVADSVMKAPAETGAHDNSAHDNSAEHDGGLERSRSQPVDSIKSGHIRA